MVPRGGRRAAPRRNGRGIASARPHRPSTSRAIYSVSTGAAKTSGASLAVVRAVQHRRCPLVTVAIGGCCRPGEDCRVASVATSSGDGVLGVVPRLLGGIVRMFIAAVTETVASPASSGAVALRSLLAGDGFGPLFAVTTPRNGDALPPPTR